jgi:serine-type D-Ala-D-Ala carboxypeptidase (penicillin-binding protein 5/6)
VGEHEIDPWVPRATRRALLRGGLGGLLVAAGSLAGCTTPWRGMPSPAAPEPAATWKPTPPASPTSVPRPTFPLTPTVARRPGPPPAIGAHSAIVWDATRRVELYAKAPDDRVVPASTTKLVSALLVLEHARLDRPVRIDPVDVALPEDESRMGTPPGDVLAAGDTLTFEDLLFGMLLASGADAARAAARAVGEMLLGGQPGDPLARFVREMNAHVAALGLVNSHFVNPDGYEEANHYSSARDLLLLTYRAMERPEFAAIVATKTAVRRTLDGRKTFALENTNQLLGTRAGVHGVKTGTAGVNLEWECLISAQWTPVGRFLAVVLGSSQGQRYTDTVALLDWANTGYH